MPTRILTVGLLACAFVGPAGPASAAPAVMQALFDFVTFDGIDYIRWDEEPGRALGPPDLGTEFATVACSFGEDRRSCPYGTDAGAAFMPAGTRVYAVRGYATEFRLAAVWRERIFLYQAWRNPRARVGADLFDLAGKVRAVEVDVGGQDGEPARHAMITASPAVDALVQMILRAGTQRPLGHTAAELRYWLTFWLLDGTTLGRPFYPASSELMGGVVVGAEFTQLLERHLKETP
jgi:hypothetical protein